MGGLEGVGNGAETGFYLSLRKYELMSMDGKIRSKIRWRIFVVEIDLISRNLNIFVESSGRKRASVQLM